MVKKAAEVAEIPGSSSERPEFEPKDLPHYSEIPALTEFATDDTGTEWTFEELADEIDSLNDAKTTLEEQIARLKILEKQLMEATGNKSSFSVRIREDLGMMYIRPTKARETLVREMLIVAGVTEKQLKKGTKKGKIGEPYVQLLKPTKAQKEKKAREKAVAERDVKVKPFKKVKK